MKACTKCNKPINRTSSRANNVKYCKPCRVEVYKYRDYRRKWQMKKRDEIAEKVKKGKIECRLCGRYYKKPLSHAYSRHQVDEKEYKKMYGLDHQKGLILPEMKEILRDHVKTNYDLVVRKNLLRNGKLTRYVQGDTRAGKYERSRQTIKRLKVLYKLKTT